MADYRFRETEDGMSVLEKKVEGQPTTWVEDMKSPTPFAWIASKDYVDDKVKEANPDFKGTFDDMADIEALENVNANDWAYLVTQDENHNDVYNRYRYAIPDGETQYTWLFEVAIKRDNFTDEEWAAITSGITPEDVKKLTALPTNTELTNALGEKADENYDDVYIGSGSAYSDAMVQANHHDNIRKGALNSVTVSDTYLWIILPSPYIPTMQMEGVVIPMTRQTDVTVSDVTYNVFKSNVSYDGTFNVILL